ncbi:3-hydroxyacyl-CoA dehydrogenase NAD-binding domain-containing protein [Nocardioides hungaricus]
MPEFAHVAVLGFGTMGAGIAQLVAQSGVRVTVLESEQGRVAAGRRFVEDFLEKGVARGKTSPEERDAVLGRITGTLTVADLADADLVIEAITEQRDAKAELFRAVDEVVSTDAVVVTNTSALSVTDLSTSVREPGRFAGLHFFNPAPLMKVIEVVRAVRTDQSVVTGLEAFVQSLGKDPVVVKDRPGFLVNHLLMPYLNDVVQAYDDELATAEDIDVALKLGLGYKLGPLELLDMIGLDVHRHATGSAYAATLDPAYAVPPLLHQMVAAGRLGNKSGEGFRTGEKA